MSGNQIQTVGAGTSPAIGVFGNNPAALASQGGNFFTLAYLNANFAGTLPGQTIWCSDGFLAFWNGTVWAAFGSGTGSGGVPDFTGNIISPAQAASGPLNDYAPTGFSSTTTNMRVAAAVGNTTVNSLVATGWTKGSFLWTNTSTTDSFIFNNNGGGTAANQFLTASLGQVIIPPQGQAIVTRDITSARWRFA